MKRTGIVAGIIGALCIAASSAAFAQAKVYWTTSGMFGPFDIRGLIPALRLTSPG